MNRGPPEWLRRCRGSDLKGLDLWDSVYASAGNKYLGNAQQAPSANQGPPPPVQPYMVRATPVKKYLAPPRASNRQHAKVAQVLVNLPTPSDDKVVHSSPIIAAGAAASPAASPSPQPVFDDAVGASATATFARPQVPKLHLSNLPTYPSGSVYSFTPTPVPTPGLTPQAATDLSPAAASSTGDWEGTASHASSEPGSRLRASRELDAALQYLKDTQMSPFTNASGRCVCHTCVCTECKVD
jgi:hypothetical protein